MLAAAAQIPRGAYPDGAPGALSNCTNPAFYVAGPREIEKPQHLIPYANEFVCHFLHQDLLLFLISARTMANPLPPPCIHTAQNASYRAATDTGKSVCDGAQVNSPGYVKKLARKVQNAGDGTVL